MEWRRIRPAIGILSAVERCADGAVSGSPDEVVGGEIGVFEQLCEVGQGLGFSSLEVIIGFRCSMDAVGMIRCFGIGLRQ